MRICSPRVFLTCSMSSSLAFRASRKPCSPPARSYSDLRAFSSSPGGHGGLGFHGLVEQELLLGELDGAALDDRLHLGGFEVLELGGPGPHVVQNGLEDLPGGDVEPLGPDENVVGRRVERRDLGRKVLGQLVGRRAFLESDVLGLPGAGREEERQGEGQMPQIFSSSSP